MKTKTIKERVQEFEKLLPCINRDCDGKGSIPERDGEGNWQQAQCEYCFVVRFPMFKAITKALKQTEERVIGEIETIMDKDTARLICDQQEMVWGERSCKVCGYDPERQRKYIINKLKKK